MNEWLYKKKWQAREFCRRLWLLKYGVFPLRVYYLHHYTRAWAKQHANPKHTILTTSNPVPVTALHIYHAQHDGELWIHLQFPKEDGPAWVDYQGSIPLSVFKLDVG